MKLSLTKASNLSEQEMKIMLIIIPQHASKFLLASSLYGDHTLTLMMMIITM